MRSAVHIKRWACALAMLATTAAVLPGSPLPMATAQAAEPGLGAGGEYHPLTPSRVYDSRAGLAGSENDVAPLGAKAIGTTFDIQVLGKGGAPATGTDVLAVVANITVVGPTSDGYLNAYGKGANAGLAAIINFKKGQGAVPNLAIVRPGADGKVTIQLAAGVGKADVVVDVFGWFSTSAAADRGARLVPVTPGRILDTRTALNRTPAATPLKAQETITVPIRGVDAVDPAVTDIVPNDPSVVGVVLNLAGVNNTAGSTGTHISIVPDALPAGQAPGTANLNLDPGQVKSNMVIVPVGADGNIRVFNNQGTTDVVLDVVGYLVSGKDVATRAGRVVPLSAPYRVFDTRETQWGKVPLGGGQAEDWSFSDFATSVNIGGVAVGNQMGVIGNLTSAQLAGAPGSYLTVYPSDAPKPTSANLNMTSTGGPVPNMVIMKYSANTTVRVYNNQGNDDYVYDASAVILAD